MKNQEQLRVKRIQFMTELRPNDHDRLTKLAVDSGLSRVEVLRMMIRNCTIIKHTRVIEDFEFVMLLPTNTAPATMEMSV